MDNKSLVLFTALQIINLISRQAYSSSHINRMEFDSALKTRQQSPNKMAINSRSLYNCRPQWEVTSSVITLPSHYRLFDHNNRSSSDRYKSCCVARNEKYSEDENADTEDTGEPRGTSKTMPEINRFNQNSRFHTFMQLLNEVNTQFQWSRQDIIRI